MASPVNPGKSLRVGLLLALFVLGAVLVVSLSGFTPAQFGHTANNELAFETRVVSATCDDKFCSAACPADFRVTSGGCGVVSPRFTQFNLFGASGDQTAWNCFDSAWKFGSSAVQANAICMRVGNPSPPRFEFCGNYTVEPVAASPSNISEICDLNNTDPVDCGDFLTSTGQPLCNGFPSCNATCDGYDISACEFCATSGACPAGYTLCEDNTCQLSCPGMPSGETVGGVAAGCSPGVPCAPVNTPPPYPSGGFCGDLIQQPLTEQCDGSGTNCPSDPTFHCPPGSIDTSTAPTCNATCGCVTHNSCLFPLCGNGQLDPGEGCEGSDAGTCPVMTGGTTFCQSCNCVFVPFEE